MKKNLHLPKFFLILPTLALVGLGVFALIQPAAAMSDYIETLLMGGFSAIMAGLIELLGNTLLVVINIFLGVVEYNGFSDATAVIKGWVIMRDVGNMFFVIILLIIAISTILNIETYQYKKLLPRLLIMALLINFSKAIAAFLIDVSQIAMLTFVNGFAHTAAGNFTTAFGLNEFMSLVGEDEWGNRRELDSSLVFQAYVLALVFMLVALITITIITLVLMFRIVALWILIVLSPVAYLAAAFPAGQRYSQQWWQKFGHYLVSGPVLAFFVWIALTVTAKHTGNLNKELEDVNLSEEEILDEDSELSAAATKLGKSESVMSFILGVAMLMGGLVATQQLAVAGGKMAGNWMGRLQAGVLKPVDKIAKIAKAPFKAVGFGASAVKKAIARDLIAKHIPIFSPTAWKKAWESRQSKKDRQVYPYAQGRLQDMITVVLSLGQEKGYEAKLEFERAVEERQREYEAPDLDEKEHAELFLNAKSDVDKLAAARSIFAKNRQDDVSSSLVEQGNEDWDDFLKKSGVSEADLKGPERVNFNEEAFNKYLQEKYFGPKRGKEFTRNLSEYSEKIGKIRGFATHETDSKKIAEETIKRMKRNPSEQMIQSLEGGIFRNVKKDGSLGEFTRSGKIIFQALSNLLGDSYERARRIQARSKDMVGLTADEETYKITPKSTDYSMLRESLKHGDSWTIQTVKKCGFSNADLEKIENELNIKAGSKEYAGIFDGIKVKEQKIVEPIVPREDGILGLKTAKTTKQGGQAGLGVDFNSEHFKNLGLTKNQIGYYFEDEDKDEAVKKIQEYYQDYLQRTTQLAKEGIDKEVEKLGQSLSQAGTIRLTNITHPAAKSQKYAIARHEKAHPKVNELSSERIDGVLNTLNPQDRGELLAHYSERWGGVQPGQSGRELEREIVADMKAGWGRVPEDQSKHYASKFMNEQTVRAMQSAGLVRREAEPSVPAAKKTTGAPMAAPEAETISALEGLTAAFDTSGMELSLGTIANNLQTLQEELRKSLKVDTKGISQDIAQAIKSAKGLDEFSGLDPLTQKAEVSRQLFNINKNLKEITRGLRGSQAVSAEKIEEEAEGLADNINQGMS